MTNIFQMMFLFSDRIKSSVLKCIKLFKSSGFTKCKVLFIQICKKKVFYVIVLLDIADRKASIFISILDARI